MLAIDALTKRYGVTLAVDGLSFEVPAGRILGFLGPNGAGKTTTLRALLGLIVPSAGAALIEGKPYAALRDPARVVGAVLEGPQFHPGRTGREHLRVLADAAGLPLSRVEEVLRLVELDAAAGRRVRGYSQGMRQRLGLAQALLGDPRALVLDEPANGLDPQGIRWLRDFLRALGDEGRAVLVSSHVLAEVAQTVDEVVVISHGRLVAKGSLEQLTATRAAVRIRTPDAERLAQGLADRGIASESAGPERLVARGTSPEAVGRAAFEDRIAIYELAAEADTLEDVFLDLTGATEGANQ